MSRRDVVLFADNGELMVGRRTSSFIWGEWNVEVPEGALSEEDQLLAEYKGYGYLYKPDDYDSWDRFDLLGARADVNQKIVVDEETGLPDMSRGESDTENVIDETTRKTDEDVFFQDSITTTGLGMYQMPGRDFDVGDVVQVSVGGKLVSAVVRKITAKSSSDGDVWSIDVGGKPLQDARALSTANAEINRRIREDNLKMMRQIAEGKLTIEKLTKYLGIGEGSVEGTVTSELVDGILREIQTTNINYENFNKQITNITENILPQMSEEQKQKENEGLRLFIEDLVTKMILFTSSEVDRRLLPPIPKGTQLISGQTFTSGRMMVSRNGKDLIVTDAYFPFDVLYESKTWTITKANETIPGFFTGVPDTTPISLSSDAVMVKTADGSELRVSSPIEEDSLTPDGYLIIEADLPIYSASMLVWVIFEDPAPDAFIVMEYWNKSKTKLLQTKKLYSGKSIDPFFPTNKKVLQMMHAGGDVMNTEDRVVRVYLGADNPDAEHNIFDCGFEVAANIRLDFVDARKKKT